VRLRSVPPGPGESGEGAAGSIVGVTPILGMSKAEGMYLSADYRVTDARTGRLIDDEAVKFLHITYPPQPGGPIALLGYTGVAIMRDGTPTGTWMRETLRGESEVIDQSMAHLRARLDRDIAPMRLPLIINLLVKEPNRRLFGGLSNITVSTTTREVTVQESFGYSMQEVDKPFMFANGSGATTALANRHLHRVQGQLRVMPQRPGDHMHLLAVVNRRVAAKDKTVSPFCHVTFLSAEEGKGAESRVFVQGGESVPFEMPTILFGIDLSGIAKSFWERAQTAAPGEPIPLDDATSDDEFQRRP
jgi:hypothetical protein